MHDLYEAARVAVITKRALAERRIQEASDKPVISEEDILNLRIDLHLNLFETNVGG